MFGDYGLTYCYLIGFVWSIYVGNRMLLGAGVFGVVSSIGGVWYAYEKLTPYYPHAGLITLLVTIILFIVIFVLFLRGKTLKKMELETTIDSSVDLAKPGKRMDELTEQNNKN